MLLNTLRNLIPKLEETKKDSIISGKMDQFKLYVKENEEILNKKYDKLTAEFEDYKI